MILRAYPEAATARRDEDGNTPLLLALQGGASVNMISELLLALPRAARQQNDDDSLPFTRSYPFRLPRFYDFVRPAYISLSDQTGGLF